MYFVSSSVLRRITSTNRRLQNRGLQRSDPQRIAPTRKAVMAHDVAILLANVCCACQLDRLKSDALHGHQNIKIFHSGADVTSLYLRLTDRTVTSHGRPTTATSHTLDGAGCSQSLCDRLSHLEVWHNRILELGCLVKVIPSFGSLDFTFESIKFLFYGLYFAHTASFLVPRLSKVFL